MKRLSTLLITSVILIACAPMQIVNINSPFNAQEASIINKEGKNTITGSALIKRNDGQTVTCSGEEVYLIPYTAYANERILAIYGNTTKGIARNRVSGFNPDIAEYKTLQKRIQCNAQGFFTFRNIADGDYFVATIVKWTVDYSPQGGNLMRRLQVKGGETIEIVLAP